MTGYAVHSWADTLLIGAVDVLVWSVLAAAVTLLFRAAFGRKHCPGCSCKSWKRAEADEPDTLDGDDYPDYWPDVPTAILGEDGRDSGRTVWAPAPGRHRPA